jgi:hypothetical protein
VDNQIPFVYAIFSVFVQSENKENFRDLPIKIMGHVIVLNMYFKVKIDTK